MRSLGRSATAHYFGLSGLVEADRYLSDAVLGERHCECCEILRDLECSDALKVLGPPGNLKLHSSMTLFFKCASFETSALAVLDKFFGSHLDERTVQLLDLDLRK
ncbi:DUF1810 family protein [Sulfitobacter sp.]|uniref:DUF1810 family protein n=1 Tax=Sulfitobacter sp. TaxID=1903071 RepID=UPI003FCD1AD4